MALYNLYAGMGGGFGGATYEYTSDFPTQKEAESAAYDIAWEWYQSYEGANGIMSEEDCSREYCETNGLNFLDIGPEEEADIEDMYIEEVENWIDYRAVLTEEDDLEEDELDVR